MSIKGHQDLNIIILMEMQLDCNHLQIKKHQQYTLILI